MGFLFGLGLPAEKVAPLILGPVIALVGTIGTLAEFMKPGQVSLWWCAFDIAGGIAITIYGLVERRRRRWHTSTVGKKEIE